MPVRLLTRIRGDGFRHRHVEGMSTRRRPGALYNVDLRIFQVLATPPQQSVHLRASTSDQQVHESPTRLTNPPGKPQIICNLYVGRIKDVGQSLDEYWVKKYRQDHPEPEQKVTPADHGRLDELEEENRLLKMENEFLKNQTRLKSSAPSAA